MSEVRVRENESLESALKRFKRQCARSGVIQEWSGCKGSLPFAANVLIVRNGIPLSRFFLGRGFLFNFGFRNKKNLSYRPLHNRVYFAILLATAGFSCLSIW